MPKLYKEESYSYSYKDETVRPHYFQVTDLWRRLCEEHTELFDITCEEYAHLLRSDLDQLEETIEKKMEQIERIGTLEAARREIMNEINTKLSSEPKIDTVKDLIILMENYEEEKGEKHLFRFNELLIEIIEKIQAQNKKNQLFINKSLHSLKEIRQEAMGEKSYPSYNQKGITK